MSVCNACSCYHMTVASGEQSSFRCLQCLLRMSVYHTNAIVPLPISSVRASDSGCHLTVAGHCQSLLSRWQRILRMTVCPTNTMFLSIISPIRSSEHAQHSAYSHETSTIAQHVACPARYDVSIPSCHASDRPDLPLQPQSIPPTHMRPPSSLPGVLLHPVPDFLRCAPAWRTHGLVPALYRLRPMVHARFNDGTQELPDSMEAYWEQVLSPHITFTASISQCTSHK